MKDFVAWPTANEFPHEARSFRNDRENAAFPCNNILSTHGFVGMEFKHVVCKYIVQTLRPTLTNEIKECHLKRGFVRPRNWVFPDQ